MPGGILTHTHTQLLYVFYFWQKQLMTCCSVNWTVGGAGLGSSFVLLDSFSHAGSTVMFPLQFSVLAVCVPVQCTGWLPWWFANDLFAAIQPAIQPVHQQFSVLDGCFVLSQTIRSSHAQAPDESRCCSTPDLLARRRAQMNWEKEQTSWGSDSAQFVH